MHIMITNISLILLEERPYNYIISTLSIVPFFSRNNIEYIGAKSAFTLRISEHLWTDYFSLHQREGGKDYTQTARATLVLG